MSVFKKPYKNSHIGYCFAFLKIGGIIDGSKSVFNTGRLMHYYTFNIGDYRRDTSHLSLLEHGIYRQLIDTYYLNEQPLTADLDTLMRTHSVRSAIECEALKNVLADFFELTAEGYIHTGCERVLGRFHGKSEKARLSAKARWERVPEKNDANGMRTHSERNAIGMLPNNPITHKPIKDKKTKTTPERPMGVDETVWSDFLSHRKGLRAAVTATALKGIEREAIKAGWTLNDALTETVARGWRGFKAEWVQKKMRDVVDDTRLAMIEDTNRTLRRLQNADTRPDGPTVDQITHTLRGSLDAEMGGLGPVDREG